MRKGKKLGNVSYGAEAYEKFVSLTKEEQIKELSVNLNPKSERLAEKLLKDIPNGGISNTNDSEVAIGEALDSRGDTQDNTGRSEAIGSKSTGAKTGGKSR